MDNNSDDQMEDCSPPDIAGISYDATNNVLPEKSRGRYEKAYQCFMDWRVNNAIDSFSENVFLAYFEEKSETFKPSSLWAIFSMLKSTIQMKHNININTYTKLMALLKRKSDGYQSTKSKILSAQQVQEFLENADDCKYLLEKVLLLIGISGACRKRELKSLYPKDIEDTGTSFIVTLRNAKNQMDRRFVVPTRFYSTCKKYMNLRPTGNDVINLPLFLRYSHKKCTKQCVGINIIGKVPSRIAKFLKLPDSDKYTGHCFRRTSATIFADAGGDLLALKFHGGWTSSRVAKGYVDNSKYNKQTESSTKILNAIAVSNPQSMNNYDNVVIKQEEVIRLGPEACEGNTNTKYADLERYLDEEKPKCNEDLNNDKIVETATIATTLNTEPNEFEKFGQYVAMELQSLKSEYNRARLKSEIRKAIATIADEELLDVASTSTTAKKPSCASTPMLLMKL